MGATKRKSKKREKGKCVDSSFAVWHPSLLTNNKPQTRSTFVETEESIQTEAQACVLKKRERKFDFSLNMFEFWQNATFKCFQ